MTNQRSEEVRQLKNQIQELIAEREVLQEGLANTERELIRSQGAVSQLWRSLSAAEGALRQESHSTGSFTGRPIDGLV